MEQQGVCCPVCCLFLREGITLQAHLDTHPKDRVIEALLRVGNVSSTPVTSQPAEEHLQRQSCVSQNIGSVIHTKTQRSLQTQVTSAVTYQHFVTTNPSTVMPPQYVHMVPPNRSPPVVSNQPVTLMSHPPPPPPPPAPPHLPPPCVHSIYNPMYNPYIPPPYPLVHPIYTNMPFPSDVHPHMSTSHITSPVVAPSPSQSASGERSELILQPITSAATNSTIETATSEKKKSKRLLSRSKLQSKRQSESQRKFNLKKQPKLKTMSASTSTGSLSELLAQRCQTATNVNVATCAAASTSVIAEARSWRFEDNKPLSPQRTGPSTSSASVITQLPNTPGAMFRSRSSSEASTSPSFSPCPTPRSVPYESPPAAEGEEMQSESEDSDDSEQSSQSAGNVSECPVNTERDASSCSVITDRNSALQLSGDAFDSSFSMYENMIDVDSQNDSAFPRLPLEAQANKIAREQQPGMPENICDSFARQIFAAEHCECGEEFPEKMFNPYGREQEKRVAIRFELGAQDASQDNSQDECSLIRGGMLIDPDDPVPVIIPSGMIGAQGEGSESEYSDNGNGVRTEGENTTPGVKKVSSVIFLGNGSGVNPVAPSGERDAQAEEEGDYSDTKSLTYTDLQPATGSSVLEGLDMASSLNLNNYMEVDGVKIYFSGNEQNLPLEPVVRFPNPQTDESRVEDDVKPEEERDPLAESVIQLASGATQKSDSPGETGNTSTSENNTEVRDLSPLSLNIRADESMPARGELSEQESLGAENTAWNIFHAQIQLQSLRDVMRGNEFRSTFLDIEDYDRESKPVKCPFWREGFPYIKEENLDESTMYGKSKQRVRKTKNFACAQCKGKFKSHQARKNHVLDNHVYDHKEDNKTTEENETKYETRITSKENSVESVREYPVESTMEPVKAEKFEEDEAVMKSEFSVSQPMENSSSCEVGRDRVCPGCDLPIVANRKLGRQLKEVPGRSTFKCGTCSEIFKIKKEYSDHLQIHPIKCNQCGKLFNRKGGLRLHMKRHMTDKPFKCNQCPKTFVTQQKLEEHMNGHEGSKPLQCTSCDKSFSRHSNLVQHRNLHHICNKKKTKDFICRCGEMFRSAGKLAWHKELHDLKPKTCSYCSQKFIHSHSVTRHIRRSHVPQYLPDEKRDSDNIQCPICGKIFLRASLPVHLRCHTGEKPYACKICGKRFSTKWNLQLHNWTHQSRSNMPFKCTYCKSAFYREIDYVAHINSHKNFRPFTCNICGQKFIRKYNCIRHQEEHKKDKKFVCTVIGCEKTFQRSYYLRDHMRTHTGARPFTCHICGKASTTKSNHNKHIRTHDTREPLNTEN